MIKQFNLTQNLTDTTTPGQRGPGSNKNEVVLHISRSFKVGASPSDAV